MITITTKRGDDLGTKWTAVSCTLCDSFCTGRRDPSSHSIRGHPTRNETFSCHLNYRTQNRISLRYKKPEDDLLTSKHVVLHTVYYYCYIYYTTYLYNNNNNNNNNSMRIY